MIQINKVPRRSCLSRHGGGHIAKGMLRQCSIYIHFPFCSSKCGYCDFHSVTANPIPQVAYSQLILKELHARKKDYQEYLLRSIYFGGGTPALWQANEIKTILDEICRNFNCAKDLEITLEANPGTVTKELLTKLRETGINRLSLGIQTFHSEALNLLGRKYSPKQAQEIIFASRKAGFDNLSADLLIGWPGQSREQFLDDLERLIAFKLEHVSAYSLTLSETSPLGKLGFRPVVDDEMSELMRKAETVLKQAGFEHYEVSNYAQPSRASVHNSLTWSGFPYLGLGAAAHSMMFVGPTTIRVANPCVDQYMLGPGSFEPQVEKIEGKQARYELMFLGLRTRVGVDRKFYQKRFCTDAADDFAEPLTSLASAGLVQISPAHIAPTTEGLWFADELALRLL